VADLFLTEGRIVSTKGRNKEENVYTAKEEGTLLVPADKYPIAILIYKFSASASEIVSAALQDHHRAVIIGERSYGKGSVQNVIEMENHQSALKLTTASYWRPSGKNIHRFPDSKESDEWGVKPDAAFEVPLTDKEGLAYFTYRQKRDIVHGKIGTMHAPKPLIEKSSEDSREPKAASTNGIPAKKPDGEEKPFEDRVLQKALEYLRGEVQKVGAAAPTLPEVVDG